MSFVSALFKNKYRKKMSSASSSRTMVVLSTTIVYYIGLMSLSYLHGNVYYMLAIMLAYKISSRRSYFSMILVLRASGLQTYKYQSSSSSIHTSTTSSTSSRSLSPRMSLHCSRHHVNMICTYIGLPY